MLSFLLIALIASCVCGTQVPLQFWGDDSWDLERTPHVNATGHLIFATASSFLQHWPNTRYRNGHSLVAGIVPTGTLLYHGTFRNDIPTMPDWVATDPEHSYLFCSGQPHEGCWHLTLVSVRPLKVLYFDGSSAAKMREGSMDTQDIVTWHKINPDQPFGERERIDQLCRWGQQFGLDGFVRMEMDFEIMLCNFTAGVEVVSLSNLVSLRDWGPPRRTPIHPSLDPRDHGEQVIYAGSWHNYYPGETRVRLDYSRFISFYDTSLVPSLTAVRFGQTRLEHRLEGISEGDLNAVISRLESMLSEDLESSGTDWETLLRVIQDRFAERLELLRHILNATDTESASDLLIRAQKSQNQLDAIVQPYMLFTAVPEPAPSTSWAQPIFKLCATTHTKFIRSPVLSFTSSERMLLQAIEETNREICRVVVKLWVEGVQVGLDDLVKPPIISEPDSDLVQRWRTEIENLMGWLDWSVWLKCRPACGVEEICYLPTWPYFMIGAPRAPRHDPPPGEEEPSRLHRLPLPDGQDYKDPKPSCIRRIEPYTFQPDFASLMQTSN